MYLTLINKHNIVYTKHSKKMSHKLNIMYTKINNKIQINLIDLENKLFFVH